MSNLVILCYSHKASETQKDKHCVMSLVCDSKRNHRKSHICVTRGGVWTVGELDVDDLNVQTSSHRINESWGWNGQYDD